MDTRRIDTARQVLHEKRKKACVIAGIAAVSVTIGVAMAYNFRFDDLAVLALPVAVIDGGLILKYQEYAKHAKNPEVAFSEGMSPKEREEQGETWKNSLKTGERILATTSSQRVDGWGETSPGIRRQVESCLTTAKIVIRAEKHVDFMPQKACAQPELIQAYNEAVAPTRSIQACILLSAIRNVTAENVDWPMLEKPAVRFEVDVSDAEIKKLGTDAAIELLDAWVQGGTGRIRIPIFNDPEGAKALAEEIKKMIRYRPQTA